MKKIIDMRQERANLVNQAREIVERAEEQKREMSADEDTQYSNIMKDVSNLKKKIDREEQLQASESDLDQPLNTPHRQNPENGQQNSENPRATEEYQNAFNRFLRSGMGALSHDQIQNMQSTSDPEGGFLVTPQTFVTQLLKEVDDQVFIRQLATKFKLDKADSMGVPSLDADPDDADWTSELRTGNETDLKFGKRELHPHPLAKRVKASNKLLRASAVAIDTLIRQRLAYKYGVTQEKAFMMGTGANQPLGLFTASTSGISTSRDVANGNTATDIKFDGLKSAKYTLKGQYHKNAAWIFHRNAVEKIDKEKDANGQYIWQPGVREGEPDKILNLPYYMSEYAPNTFTTGKYVGLLGDLSYYWIADALDLQIQRLVELYAERNQTGYIGRLETDGMPVMEEAFVRVKLG